MILYLHKLKNKKNVELNYLNGYLTKIVDG